MHGIFTERDILAHFADYSLDSESSEYLRFHSLRYVVLLHTFSLVTGRMDNETDNLRVMDIGPGFLTQFMRDRLSEVTVDSLGFEDKRFSRRSCDSHFEFNLNESGSAASPAITAPYDVIIMAEVIEHLHSNPENVLKLVSEMLVPGGYLILQTPNACSLPKRLRMLRGQNPFEMIRDDPGNPGHYREYTLGELCILADGAGLTDVDRILANYFKRDTRSARLFRLLATFVPGTWRDGITLCLKKREA